MFSADDVRAVEREQILAAQPVEVDVADAVAAAQHRLAVVDRVGQRRARGAKLLRSGLTSARS